MHIAIKTIELTGQPLRWAMFLAEGLTPILGSQTIPAGGLGDGSEAKTFYGALCKERDVPGLDWSFIGPIIGREGIELRKISPPDLYNEWGDQPPWPEKWEAKCGMWTMSGPTPLIAVMRCFLTSKLGEKVEIPEELLTATLASVLGDGELA